jgi:hypothetical protein
MLAEVKVRVENSGRLGTRSALGKKTRYAQQPPRSVLVFLESAEDNVEILSVPRTLRLGVLEGTDTSEKAREALRKAAEAPQAGEVKIPDNPCIGEGSWLIKITGRTANLTVKVISERGGTSIKKVKIQI